VSALRPGLAVVAIGGNSLIRDAQHQSVPDQFACTRETTEPLADMVRAGWRVVITHGNGPQVGFILIRSELASSKIHPVPLDSIGADTQGAIGYMIQQALTNAFHARGHDQGVVTLITQVVVDRDDPGFKHPSKPIGPFLSEHEARQRQADGVAMIEDAGRGWRRVVASPQPLEIVELPAIRALLPAGQVVIAVGGGGIPVVREPDGSLRGVEAVIDKDLASALLASSLGADLLLISTAVPQVALDWGKPTQRPLSAVVVEELRGYYNEGQFAAGSMGPKIGAVLRFLDAGGSAAVITDPQNLTRALEGGAGTLMLRESN
jgi:carbamate kinase